jgi:hypothetical protein
VPEILKADIANKNKQMKLIPSLNNGKIWWWHNSD